MNDYLITYLQILYVHTVVSTLNMFGKVIRQKNADVFVFTDDNRDKVNYRSPFKVRIWKPCVTRCSTLTRIVHDWVLGGSDIALFAISKMGTMLPDQVYFYESNSKKSV